MIGCCKCDATAATLVNGLWFCAAHVPKGAPVPDRRERMAVAACASTACHKGCAVGLASRRGDRPDSCGAIADRCLSVCDEENKRLREALQYFLRGFDAHNTYLADTYGPDAVIPDDVHTAAARALLAEIGQ